MTFIYKHNFFFNFEYFFQQQKFFFINYQLKAKIFTQSNLNYICFIRL